MESKAKSGFEKVKHELVPMAALRVHPEVQRGRNQARVDFLAANFDPDQFGELSAVRVPGRTYYLVFDGQHRLEAARQQFGNDQRVPCAIYDDCPIERQAKIFLGQNDRLALTAVDKWAQRVIAQDDVVLNIEAILKRHGLRSGKTKGNNTVCAVAALERAYKRTGGPISLDRALAIIKGAWGGNPDAYDNHFITGVVTLCSRFDGKLDDRDFSRKLATSEGPLRIIGQARSYADACGFSVARAMAHKLLDIYNKSRHSQKLSLDN